MHRKKPDRKVFSMQAGWMLGSVVHRIAMASTLVAMASNLVAMACTLLATASNPRENPFSYELDGSECQGENNVMCGDGWSLLL